MSDSPVKDAKSIPAAREVQLLLTAHEAYPELERLFLTAKTEIWGSFLVFDLKTALRSDEGLAIGRTWFDLVLHTLRRGVAITMTISDVDPVLRAQMHRGTWRSVRMFCAAADLADAGSRLRIVPAMHASETGIVPRILLSPVIMLRLWRTARWLNRLEPAIRAASLREMPGVARRMREGASGRLRPRLWPIPRLFPGTHHQKIAVFDRQILYVGGLDLDERRYDTPDHDQVAEQTWHDVQLRITGGAAVAAAQAHLETFLATTEGRAPAAPPSGLLRTLSRQRANPGLHLGPEPVLAELRDAHLAAIARARHLIYLETQYFRDRGLAHALARAAQRNPALSLILILPGAPDDLAFEGKMGIDVRGGEWLQSRCIRTIKKAFGTRLFVGGPAQRRADAGSHPRGRDSLHGAPIIYVHAKVSIFDDAEAIISSANLNGRSLRWDTEAGVRLQGADVIAPIRHRIMAHWLPQDAGAAYLDPRQAVRHWRALGIANARAAPEKRQGFIVPYDLRAAERDGGAIAILPDEMV